MTERRTFRRAVHDAMLDQEEVLSDLKASLAALSLIASASEGIEKDDMIGLRYVTNSARDLASSLYRSWRDAVDSLGPRSGSRT